LNKVLYLFDFDIRVAWAPAIQVMNTCAGFAAQGREVTLVNYYYLPWGNDRIRGDYWAYFGLAPTFRWQTLPTLLWKPLGHVPGAYRFIKAGPVMIYCAWLWLRWPFSEDDLIYGRSPGFIRIMPMLRRAKGNIPYPKIVYEAHEPLEGAGYRHLLHSVDGIVCLTQALADYLHNQYGVPRERLYVEGDAVSIEKFGVSLAPEEREAIRRRWRFPEGATIGCWAGWLNESEMNVLIEAAAHLDKSLGIVVIGGPVQLALKMEALAHVRRLPIRFIGPVPHRDVPKHLQAADLLLCPYTGRLRWSPFFSPVKVFEYMAARRPIISSDLPAIREVLRHGENAYLVPPDDPGALARAMKELSKSPDLQNHLVAGAWADAQAHTWERRAQRILNFCDHLKVRSLADRQERNEAQNQSSSFYRRS